MSDIAQLQRELVGARERIDNLLSDANAHRLDIKRWRGRAEKAEAERGEISVDIHEGNRQRLQIATLTAEKAALKTDLDALAASIFPEKTVGGRRFTYSVDGAIEKVKEMQERLRKTEKRADQLAANCAYHSHPDDAVRINQLEQQHEADTQALREARDALECAITNIQGILDGDDLPSMAIRDLGRKVLAALTKRLEGRE